jgi:hypothetical protein
MEKVIEGEVILNNEAPPQPGTALVVPAALRAQLEAEAKGMASRIAAPGGDFIKLTKDKNFKLPDGTKHPGPLTVVILDFVSGNFFYDRPYKDGEITPPACFALGLEPTSLVPSKTSPVKQSDNCKDCPNNQFGSKGDGKACQNNRIVALVAGTEPEGADVNSPMYLLKISPTGVKAFDGYIASVRGQFGYGPIVVTTDVFFDPSVDYQSLRFGNPQPNRNIEVHMTRRIAARQRLLQEPDVSQYTPLAKKARK